MTTPAKRVFWAVFLCFLFGPFGLGYVNKKAAIALSVLMLLTVGLFFFWIIGYSNAHPIQIDDLSNLQSGHFTESTAGLQSIFYYMTVAMTFEWVISMVVAFLSAKAHQPNA